MAMTFDATLKDMGRESPLGFLATFDQPPALAVLGRFPENLSLEDGLTLIANRLVERITKEAPADRAQKLLTDAYLLTGLRLRRAAAERIFRE